jgi:hypothetical protein
MKNRQDCVRYNLGRMQNWFYLYLGNKICPATSYKLLNLKFSRDNKGIGYFYKKLTEMETLLVKLKHEKARKLLQDLEDLEIL